MRINSVLKKFNRETREIHEIFYQKSIPFFFIKMISCFSRVSRLKQKRRKPLNADFRFKSKEKNYEDEDCFSIGLNRLRAPLISIYNEQPYFYAECLY